MRKTAAVAGLLLALVPAAASAQGALELLNRTTRSFVKVHFTPIVREVWGENQVPAGAALKPQGKLPFSVDFRSGRYHIRVVDSTGTTCLVKSVVVKAADLLAITEGDLTACVAGTNLAEDAIPPPTKG